MTPSICTSTWAFFFVWQVPYDKGDKTHTCNPNSTEVGDLAVEMTSPQSARADDASSKHEPPLRAGPLLDVEKCPEERRSSPKPLKRPPLWSSHLAGTQKAEGSVALPSGTGPRTEQSEPKCLCSQGTDPRTEQHRKGADPRTGTPKRINVTSCRASRAPAVWFLVLPSVSALPRRSRRSLGSCPWSCAAGSSRGPLGFFSVCSWSWVCAQPVLLLVSRLFSGQRPQNRSLQRAASSDELWTGNPYDRRYSGRRYFTMSYVNLVSTLVMSLRCGTQFHLGTARRRQQDTDSLATLRVDVTVK